MGNKQLWTEPVLGLNRQRIVERCQQAITTGRGETFIYLVATRALLDDVTARILDGDRVRGCRELRVFLFDGLTERILKHAGDRRTLIRDGSKYFMLEHVMGQLLSAGTIGHFRDIALLPGAIESMGALIGEIKRAGMSPEMFHQFVNTGQPRLRDLDIAAVYQAYQHLLDERGLMDGDEAMVRALALLQSQPDLPPWLDTTTTLFIDGFFDFTPIQKHLLRYLIERVPDVVINLIFDPRHPSVFAEPLSDTSKYLKSFSQQMEAEHFEETAPHDSTLEPLRAGLFHPGGQTFPQEPPITIRSGVNSTHEVQEIGKEIKRLIIEEDIRPEDIGVIVREPSGYLQAISQELHRLGIPSALGVEAPLSTVPSVKAAVKVLDCRVSQENTEPYLALLKNDYLDHFSRLHPDAVENAVLMVGAQIPVRQWRRRARDIRRSKEYELTLLAGRFVDQEELEGELMRLRRDIEQLEAASEAIDKMRQALEQIPERGTFSQLIQGFWAALHSFGLRHRLQQRLKRSADDGQSLRLLSRDLRGLDALTRALEEIQRIGAEPGPWFPDRESSGDQQPMASDRQHTGGDQLTINEFQQLTTHLLNRTPFRAERGDPGGVRLLEATQSRGLPFRVVFIAGLIEGLFPLSPARDWIYPYSERQNLALAGLFLEDLSPKVFQAKEEHFFYHAACQATERLYLTYPRADSGGEENVVSSFIHEVQRLYKLEGKSLLIEEERNPSTYDVRSAASQPELARTVLASLYQTTADDDLVVHLYNHALATGILDQSVFARLGIERERQGRSFGPFDGLLIDPIIRQQLRRRFGSRHIYSASQLNTYGKCPFQFFCHRVLRLEERQEASLDLLAIDRGWLLHDILRDFLQRHTGATLTRLRQREYSDELARIADKAFDRFEERAWPIRPSLWALEKEKIRHTLEQFLNAEIRYQELVSAAGVQPYWLELGFGMVDLEEGSSESNRDVFELRRDDDVISLRGRIDRVDRSADNKYIVYDYKSGSGAGLREMREGVDLQIQLYIRALGELFLGPGEEVVGGGYYSLKNLDRKRGLYQKEFESHTGIGGRSSSSLSSTEWKEAIDSAETCAWSYVDGMRGGDFRVQPKEDSCCPRCVYQTVCRYQKHRIGAKVKKDESS